MIKVKHVRTADCVVAGFRWHRTSRDAVFAAAGPLRRPRCLHHVGVTRPSTSRAKKTDAGTEPLRERALEGIPGPAGSAAGQAMRSACPAPKPVERRQGPFVGAAAHRARVRSEVRPPAGRPLPPRHSVPAMATRRRLLRVATISWRSPPLTSWRRCFDPILLNTRRARRARRARRLILISFLIATRD